jgi:predicted DNA binding CopG/RHH family protein
MKPVQYFSDEYLQNCRNATAEQTLTFLENYRRMQVPGDVTKLISLKVPESMLAAFRQQCTLEGVKYQTQIKRLMREWLK